MNRTERETRARRIDPRLEAAGWRVVPFDPETPLAGYDGCAIEEYPTAAGPADYALCTGGRIVGVVEAKRTRVGPMGVLSQAERYSRDLEGSPFDFDGFRVPFLYATNGEVLWHRDARDGMNRSRTVAGFHTPDALAELLGHDVDGALRALHRIPAHPMMRPYQREAHAAIEQALAERKRQLLVAMATGTGKTLMTVSLVYRLMRAGLVRRVLFLVDRRALAAQAVRAFGSYEAEPGLKFDKVYEVYSQRFQREDFGEDEPFDPTVLPATYLEDPQPGHAFVYVSTIQRMTINLFGQGAALAPTDERPDEDAAQLDIPIHAFDLVIADECHRGYTAAEVSVWRAALEHFDAIKIGLTATPAAHTTAYFKEVAYRYEYERAVREGYLVDYDAVAIESGVRMNGVFLREGEQVGLVDPETGTEQLDVLEDERQFDTSDVEARVTAPASNRRILEEVKRYADEHERRTGRLPKTLIFAVNDLPHTSHADQLVDLARDVFGRGERFVQKITGRTDRPLHHLRAFRNRQEPGVVVTVDMLSTGVDVPDLEFIVFLRPVKSRILFEQMMGRGTRRGEHHPDKSHFVVFDCFGGTLLEYFREATAITASAPVRPSRSFGEIVEAVWQNRDRDYNVRCLVKRLRRVDREMSGEARDLFAAFVPDGDVGRFAEELPERLRRDFAGTMAVLRDPAFQDLTTSFPRPPRTFLVAYETQDEVSSSWIIRDGRGNEYRPGDYLAAFARYVRDHQEDVEAVRILLERPQDWGTDALSELRTKLASAPEHFTEDKLQRAHEGQYHKALVDLISMVKHAVREEEPLLSAEERVEAALARVLDGEALAAELTAEQEAWLGRIREHLARNLSIDREDFETVPIFTLAGGWGRANRAFGGHLDEWIHKFNSAIAA